MKGLVLTVPGQQGETRWGVSLVVSGIGWPHDHRCSGAADLARKAKSAQTRSLLAQVLTSAYWLASVAALVQVWPGCAIVIADEYLSAIPSAFHLAMPDVPNVP